MHEGYIKVTIQLNKYRNLKWKKVNINNILMKSRSVTKAGQLEEVGQSQKVGQSPK